MKMPKTRKGRKQLLLFGLVYPIAVVGTIGYASVTSWKIAGSVWLGYFVVMFLFKVVFALGKWVERGHDDG